MIYELLLDPQQEVATTNLFTLVIRVEYSEVRLRIRPGSRAPLPASVVRGKVSIDEHLREVLHTVLS